MTTNVSLLLKETSSSASATFFLISPFLVQTIDTNIFSKFASEFCSDFTKTACRLTILTDTSGDRLLS